MSDWNRYGREEDRRRYGSDERDQQRRFGQDERSRWQGDGGDRERERRSGGMQGSDDWRRSQGQGSQGERSQGYGSQGYGTQGYGSQGSRGFGGQEDRSWGEQGAQGRGESQQRGQGYGQAWGQGGGRQDYERQGGGGFGAGGGQEYGQGGGMFGGEMGQGGRGQFMGQGEHRGRGPKNYTRSDERIREDLNDRLSDDAWLDASEIEVQVSKCEVTLTGSVNSREDRRRAEDLAEQVSGVKHVQNNLRVQQQGAGQSMGTTMAGQDPTRAGAQGARGRPS